MKKIAHILNPSALSLMAEMVLDKAIADFKVKRLEVEMDEALSSRDYEKARKVYKKMQEGRHESRS